MSDVLRQRKLSLRKESNWSNMRIRVSQDHCSWSLLVSEKSKHLSDKDGVFTISSPPFSFFFSCSSSPSSSSSSCPSSSFSISSFSRPLPLFFILVFFFKSLTLYICYLSFNGYVFYNSLLFVLYFLIHSFCVSLSLSSSDSSLTISYLNTFR